MCSSFSFMVFAPVGGCMWRDPDGGGAFAASGLVDGGGVLQALAMGGRADRDCGKLGSGALVLFSVGGLVLAPKAAVADDEGGQAHDEEGDGGED